MTVHIIYIRPLCSFCRGTEEYLNCKGRVDIINSTLGKALGGGAGIYFKLVMTLIWFTGHRVL